MHKPHLEYATLQSEIDLAMQSVADQGMYILGPNTREFEHNFASYLECGYAVGVGSGSDALYLSLLALNIGKGDEVITTPFSFFATSEAIIRTGATPVFVDIRQDTFNIDTELIEKEITNRTKAILPVHLFGRPCDMRPILEIAEQHKLYVVEDCAQATGASYQNKKVGSIGHVGCFSFFPTKNLGTLGDGGMVTTNDQEIYKRVEMLRRHGSQKKYCHELPGINSRLDELQAAILKVKLPYLDQWNRQRRKFAHQYSLALSNNQQIRLPFVSTNVGSNLEDHTHSKSSSVCHQYTVQVDNRDFVQQQLKQSGIQSAVYYPIPLHMQPVHHRLGFNPGDFPIAEKVASQCLSLPMHPNLDSSSIAHIAEQVLSLTSEMNSISVA